VKRVALLLFGAALLAACGYPDVSGPATGPVAGTSTAAPSPSPLPSVSPSPGTFAFTDGNGLPTHTLPDGLKYIDIKVGDGASPASLDDTVTVQYTGWLSNGTKFDSSQDRGQPADFQLSGVVPGFGEGVLSMKVGGIRKLIIPPDLGYGAQGQPPTIPANSTLVFEVQLLATKPTPSPSPSASASP
jgi:peptidylprolyl isomerase